MAAAAASAQKPLVRPLPKPPTEHEQQVFRVFLGAVAHFRLDVTLRVAGGWVRNKLLDMDAKDIDIAIEGKHPDGSAMTGAKFADMVKAYQTEMGMETRSVGVIQVNPDQSRHLETACTHVLGESIDLVHLRAEDYADESRIPTVRVGTPEEDAMRRDLTVNALFYNLHSALVEDWTGCGLKDLEERVARTPLPPLQTFKDDPLRLLRTVRFVSAYNLAVSPEIGEAAAREEIRVALAEQVSRERVGIETQKAFAKNAARALELLGEYRLQGHVFRNQVVKKLRLVRDEPLEWSECGWGRVVRCGRTVQEVVPAGAERAAATFGSVLRCHYAPDTGRPTPDPALPLRVHYAGLADAVVKQGLKLSGVLSKLSGLVAAASVAIEPLCGALVKADDPAAALGEMMRGQECAAVPVDVAAPPTHRFLVYGIMKQYFEDHRLAEDGDEEKAAKVADSIQFVVRPAAAIACVVGPAEDGAAKAAAISDIVARWAAAAHPLQCVVHRQPVLRGNDIRDALGVSGQQIQKMKDMQNRLLVECPDATAAQVLEYLRRA